MRYKEYKKLLVKAQEAENLVIIGAIYQMLSVAYNLLGDKENLFSCAVRSIKALKQTDKYAMLASAYTALGVAYLIMRTFSLLFHIMTKHMHCFESTGSKARADVPS